MTGLTTFDLNRFTPYAVGFDRIFDNLTRYSELQRQTTGFPPYNIVKETEKDFCIMLALAGLTKDDVEIEYIPGEITIRSTYDMSENDDNMIHKGISMKKFNRKFTLADDIVVKGADFENGLLTINLERIIPDEKKPRLIEIK